MLGLLLAGICLWIPSFELGGTICTPANQNIECRCSECITWDVEAPSPAPMVRWYDIERTNSDGTFSVVGGTWRQDWIDEDGVNNTTPAANIWCPAKDNVMVREGQLYAYRVRACNLAGCSPYVESVEYVAAPYAIDNFRPPIMNNP